MCYEMLSYIIIYVFGCYKNIYLDMSLIINNININVYIG